MKIDYNEAADKYAANRRLHGGVLQDLLETGQVSSQRRVLEVGCGTGNYIIAVQELSCCAAWGLDPSEGMLQKAVERNAAVQFTLGPGEKLPYEDSFFDLIFSVDVIHHIQDRAAYYREAYRTLCDGGLVCTVTDSEDIIRRRPILAGYFPETVEVELARYPRMADLRALMQAAGFGQITEVNVQKHLWVTDTRAYRDKAFSSLHLISEEAFQRGLSRLEDDLRRGPVENISRYVLIWGQK